MEIAVIGLGRFGSSVATTLASRGIGVTVFDIQENRLKEIVDLVDQALILDSTDEKALQEVSIDHFDKVVIALGKTALNDSLLTALNLKEMGVENIIAKASSEAHYKLLSKIGVDSIVQPENDMGIKVANRLSANCLMDYIEVSNDILIENILVSDTLKKQAGKTIQEINLRKNFKVNIISIERQDDIIIPESNTVIQEGDLLMIIGKRVDLEKFDKHFNIK